MWISRSSKTQTWSSSANDLEHISSMFLTIISISLGFASGLTVIWRWSFCLLWLAENVRSCWTFDDLQFLCLSSSLVKVESAEPFCVWQQNSSLLWYRIFERCRFRLQRTECQWEYFAGNVFFLFWFVEYWLKKLTNRCSVLTHCYSEACIYNCAFLFLFSFDSWDTFIFVWITSKCFVLLTLVICTWFASLFLSGKRWYAHLRFLYIKIIIICNFNV